MGDKATRITGIAVVRRDIIPWFIATSIMSILYTVVIWIITNGSSDQTSQMLAAGALSGLPFLVIGLFGVLIAVREKGIWLWVTYIVSILLYTLNHSVTLSSLLVANNLLSFMLVVIMVLSIGRIVEYANMRYRIGLKEPAFTAGAWLIYCTLAITCFILTNPLIAELVICSTSNCHP